MKRALLMLLAITSLGAEPPKSTHALGVVVQGVKGKTARNTDVNLRAKISWRGPKADFRYTWSSVEGPALSSNADNHAPTLTFPAAELEAGASYHVRLQVTAEWKDDEGDDQSANASGDVEFEVNAPPHGGKCTLDTRWSGPNHASLTLGAPGWKDDDQVQYRYTLVRNSKDFLVHNWSISTSRQHVSLARPGDTLQAKCGVRDKFGDGLVALSDPITRGSNDKSVSASPK